MKDFENIKEQHILKYIPEIISSHVVEIVNDRGVVSVYFEDSFLALSEDDYLNGYSIGFKFESVKELYEKVSFIVSKLMN